MVLDDVGDLLSDLAIWGLASWTVLYHLGRVVGLGTTPVLLASVAVTLALSVTTWRHVSRLARKSQAPGTASTATTTVAPPPDAGRARRLGPVQPRARFAGPAPWVLFAVSVVLAVAAVLVHWPENKSTYGLGWLLMVAALVPLVWSLVAARGERPRAALHTTWPPTSRPATVLTAPGAPPGCAPRRAPRCGP